LRRSTASGGGRPTAARPGWRAINPATGALFSTIVLATASPIEVAGTAAEEFVAPIVDNRAVVRVVANDRGRQPARPCAASLSKRTAANRIFAAPS
jgi:hypothetical protein